MTANKIKSLFKFLDARLRYMNNDRRVNSMIVKKRYEYISESRYFSDNLLINKSLKIL